jgi:hypothetical protein
VVNAVDVKSRSGEWIWFPFIPKNTTTLLTGESAVNKSTLILQLLADFTNGKDLPVIDDVEHPTATGNVLYFNTEDDSESTIKPRFEKAGADMSKVSIMQREVTLSENNVPSLLTIDRYMAIIMETIEKENIKILAIDPLGSNLPSGISLSHGDNIRHFIEYLNGICKKMDITVIVIVHTLKSRTDDAEGITMKDIQGKSSIVETVRSVLAVEKCNVNSSERRLYQIKNSTGPDDKGLEFEVYSNDRLCTWGESFGSEMAFTQIERAVKITQKALSHTAMSHINMNSLQNRYDISPKTFQRARRELGVESVGNMYVLPEKYRIKT